MSRPLRIAAVTAGLLAAGALAGAVAANVALLVAARLTHAPLPLGARQPMLFVAMVGALFGGVLLPLTAWLFLRRVPIGLALLGTLLGTIAGGVAGWVLLLGGDPINGGVGGAVAGFALAALLLRLRASAPAHPRVSVRG